MKNTLQAAITAICITATSAYANEAEITFPFQSESAIACDNHTYTRYYQVPKTTRLKKVFIWQGLSDRYKSDVTMTLRSAARGTIFVAGHDDYTMGADGGRQVSEDFGGLFYTLTAGDTVSFEFGCSRNPNPEVPTHYMGFIVEFISIK